jgi:hypothetical protein
VVRTRTQWSAAMKARKEKPPARRDVGEAKGSQDVNVQRGQYTLQ